MNSQLKEILVYQCREFAMDCDPLAQYFSQQKSPPRFFTTLKANERGYLGTWTIKKNALYLTAFIGMLENNEEITLEDLFPDKQVVFADWFSGEIILNHGKLLALKTKNSPAIYEKDLHMEIVNGNVVNSRVVENSLEQLSGFNDGFLSGTVKNSSI
jgi:hypothetical protein